MAYWLLRRSLVAQLVEHALDKRRVTGSIPVEVTIERVRKQA